MERADEVVVKDMKKTMFLFGVLVQLVCLFIPGDRLKMSIGLWIGVIAGVAMLLHMWDSIMEALQMDEDSAKRYMQKSYAIRYSVVAVGFGVVLYFDIANVFTLLLGVMGLKISAYLQPIMHKLFQKVKKS